MTANLDEVPTVKTKKPKALPPKSALEYIPGTEAHKARSEAEKRNLEQKSKHLAELQARRQALEENFKQHQAYAIAAARAIKERDQAVMTAQKHQDELKKHRDTLRAIPLDQVLEKIFGGKRTKKSGLKSIEYQLPNGIQVGITDDKFILQREQEGGKGAINLVMKVANVEFKDAVGMLSEYFSVDNIASDLNRQRIEETRKQVINEVKQQAEPPKPNLS